MSEAEAVAKVQWKALTPADKREWLEKKTKLQQVGARVAREVPSSRCLKNVFENF
jgi:hypothetical protein